MAVIKNAAPTTLFSKVSREFTLSFTHIKQLVILNALSVLVVILIYIS